MPANLRNAFRYVVLGKNQFILSHSEYKRVLLTGLLCLISFVVISAYLVIDLAQGFLHAWPYELLCLVLSMVSLWLNRTGRYGTARTLLALSANFTVFIFATSEPIELGVYIYFITANIGSLALFGYEERHKALFFVGLSSTLFFISVFHKFNIIPVTKPYSSDYLLVNVVVNYIGTSLASAAIIYFLINIHHHSEMALRKNEKEIMEKNAELTRLNAELDRFVYSTSHDLRAPLSSMKGLLQLINMTNDPAELQKYITYIGIRVDDLDKFIREITDYARNVQQQVEFQSLNVRALVCDSLETLRYLPESRLVKVSMDIEDDVEISGDRMRLQMILNNLISNAFKYKDTDKELSLVGITFQMRGNSALFSVQDNGIGIPSESLNDIFDMYTRAHEHGHGSGLGLYIVKETVERLKGTVAVESTVGRGTRFTVEIPNSLPVDSLPHQAAN